MKKALSNDPGKKLQLRKTAVAKLNLTPAEMQIIAGGRVNPITPDETSKAMDDQTQCTGQTHDPIKPTSITTAV